MPYVFNPFNVDWKSGKKEALKEFGASAFTGGWANELNAMQGDATTVDWSPGQYQQGQAPTLGGTYQNTASQQAQQALARTAPTTERVGKTNVNATLARGSRMDTTEIDQAQAREMRARQMQALEQYAARARGEGGPSAAESQMRQGLEAQQRAASSMAAGARGDSGLARRQAMQAQNDAMLQTNQQMGVLRANEQAAALQGMAGMSSQMRAQDYDVAAQQAALQQQANMTNAQMLQQKNLANAGYANQATLTQAQLNQQANMANAQYANQSAMQQQQMNDQMAQFHMAQGLSRDQANLQAQIDMQRIGADVYSAEQGYALQAALANQQAQQQNKAGLFGAVGSAVGGIMSWASDRRVKTDIEPGEAETSRMLDALKASRFRYKDPGDGTGEWLGVMAQDMERSPIGREIVVTDPRDGKKALDVKKSLSALLAAAATLHGRVKALEGG